MYRGTNEFNMESDEVFVIKMPKLAGYWIPVDGTKIGTTKIPSKFHRIMMKMCFGFKFEIIEYK